MFVHAMNTKIIKVPYEKPFKWTALITTIMSSVTEIVQYGILFAVTIVFSMMALSMDKPEYKILMKLIAGTCWIFMSVSQFLYMDLEGLTLALGPVFAIFGFFFYAATILDWFTDRKERSYGSKRKMGVFE